MGGMDEEIADGLRKVREAFAANRHLNIRTALDGLPWRDLEKLSNEYHVHLRGVDSIV